MPFPGPSRTTRVELTGVLDVGDGPNIDYCMVFLTAIASATTLIPPSGWLPVVLGNRHVDDPHDPHFGLIFTARMALESLRSPPGLCVTYSS
jgi:hypothetical protein